MQKSLTEWLATELGRIPITLQIRASSRVPRGINENCLGIEDVLRCYRWRSSWRDSTGSLVESEDWRSTESSLSSLRLWLRSSLGPKSSEQEFLRACEAIIKWGGGARSGENGAKGFIQEQFRGGSLRHYFRDAQMMLDLDCKQDKLGMKMMNAMLIKIHSLLSNDGLPIYDSRVAGCAGALVELYCRATGFRGTLPKSISFPSTDSARRIVRHLNDCASVGVIHYGQSNTAETWAVASVNLGRLFRDILIAQPALFQSIPDLTKRMHALEASFFMLGSNLSSLRPAFERYSKVPIDWIEGHLHKKRNL
jgi:hypothetical protein